MQRLICPTSSSFLVLAGCLLLASVALPADRTPDLGGGIAKLLFTEISTSGTDQEYIEIYNPGAEPVDLSDYYLTDANYSPSGQFYYNIGLGNPSQSTVGGGAFNDFHARFPDGFFIAAGDTIVITVAGSMRFFNIFEFYPDLELWEDGAVSDNIPDMRWIFGDATENSIFGSSSTPTLTNAAETIILYHFLEGENKVTDIDVFVWKDPSSSTTSIYFNKTGVIIGSHSYLPENGTNEFDAFGAQNQFGNSYQRIDVTEGDQTPTGSNGVDGRDETSENFNTTFAMMPYDPAYQLPPVILPEGDWQYVGSGPYVDYDSDAHTWGDFNNNGIEDLFLVRSDPIASYLLINDVGLTSSGWVDVITNDSTQGGTDCVRGDYNQDGDLDLYLAKETGIDWIYTNQGEDWDWSLWGWPMDFIVDFPTINTTDVEMVDTDLDGWPEIFVTNGDGNNQLLDGRFGLTDFLPHSLRHDAGTVGAAWCDLDGDRDPDLAFVSPATGIAISLQGEPRQFNSTWLPAPVEGRDCAWADFDNDGDFDFVLTCVGSNNVLYENLGDGTFSQTALVRPDADWTTGCTWGDYDNDGFIDLHVTNIGSPNVLWHNESSGYFAAVEDTVIGHDGDDRGSSWVDIDLDGDLDLYISNHDSANRLVRNNLVSQNNWLQISVAGHHWGNQSNFAAIGAVIEVEAGGIVQRRYVGGGEAGPGHSPLVQHFGLGSAAIVDRITVHWPFRLPNGSFHSTVLQDVVANRRMEIEETVYGVSAVDPAPRYVDSLKGAQPNPFNPVTTIAYSLEQDAVVTLDIFDVRGRLVRRLVRGETMAAGLHQAEWRGKTDAGANAASGVYIYRLTAGDFTASRRMVLIR